MLRQKSLALSEQLSKLEQEVKTKKEERERQGSKNMAQVQTELIKLKRELEVSSLPYTTMYRRPPRFDLYHILPDIIKLYVSGA